MHQRLGALVAVVTLATAGVVGTGAAGAAAQENTAAVTFQNQTSGGQTVTARSATMPHRDTDENESSDFVSSDGADDDLSADPTQAFIYNEY